MSEQTILWIFGTAIAAGAAWLAFITNKTWDTSGRITKVELTLVMISKTAAKLLHADDDHHGLDYYLDKYVAREYELSWTEWEEMMKLLEVAVEKEPDDGKKLCAAFLLQVCRHKLHLPPTKLKGN